MSSDPVGQASVNLIRPDQTHSTPKFPGPSGMRPHIIQELGIKWGDPSIYYSGIARPGPICGRQPDAD